MPRVLIVDDDKFTRKVLVKVLTQDPAARGLGVEVFTAEDGQEGLEMYDRHRPDVVIADLLMPKKDGFAVCEGIRTRSGGEGVHLAVVSGVYREPAVAQRLRDQYGARLFSKPYQIESLAQHVVSLLGKEPARTRERAKSPSRIREPRQGDLAERPLPAVLLDLLEGEATGRLALRSGRTRKEVGLAVGHPVFVSSNARSETLGHFLAGRGVITDAQHMQALERASSKQERIGAALIAIGALTPQRLVAALTEQVRYKLRSTLRWSEGSWAFSPSERPPSGAHGNALDLVEVVLRGLAETADSTPDERVQALLERPLELTERGRRLLSSVRSYLSAPFADQWAPGATGASLLEKGVERGELLRVLDVLSLCEAVRAPGGPKPRPPSERPMQEVKERPSLQLFGDPKTIDPPVSDAGAPSAAPIEELEPIDSGVVHLNAAGETTSGEESELEQARQTLLEEYLRVQDVSHYRVLMVEEGASAATLSAALAERRSKFSFDFFARFDLGRDYAKLEEIHAAYDRAADVLLDDQKRRRYDSERSGSEASDTAPDLEAEIEFRRAQELLRRGDYAAAIVKLEGAVEMAPSEPAYHAALGWAVYQEEGRDASAADAARPHLNQALALDPQCAAAHEHKGVITAELDSDDAEAVFHLERSLESEPWREGALEALEELLGRRGELRRLERQYRRLLYQLGGRSPKRELVLWRRLATLYLNELGDLDGARTAYDAAYRLAPDDRGIAAAIAQLQHGGADSFLESTRKLREEWLADPSRRRAGRMLVSSALRAGRPDAAYVAASALVAEEVADEQAEELYRRYRPRFLVRAQRGLDEELWPRAVHPEDTPEIGELFGLLEPIVLQAAPLGLAEGELDEGTEVQEEDLPEPFARVRAYVAHVLGVDAPRAYARPDFGAQIHVGATSPPVLLAGDDALTCPARPELAFRLGRAMSYLKPGRALAGAYPGRFLKQVVLAAYAAVSPEAAEGVDDPDGTVALLRERIAELEKPAREEVTRLVGALSARRGPLNLSRWARALARTGDRVGLLLCGDAPLALRFAADASAPEARRDLLAFALSPAHLRLRADMGLSIDV